MRELTTEEITSVNGGVDGCYYNGQVYSEGAVVNAGSYYQQCAYNQTNNTWYWQTFTI